jgi:uncharacterized SAM-binding protein YcdF (DUF218 family)
MTIEVDQRTLVVVLGHTNEDGGQLSATALARCEKAVEVLKSNPKSDFVCTGAFGENFNRFSVPHGRLLAERIISSGIDEARFLGLTNSSSTVEDALAVLRDYLGAHSSLVVVTSPFHKERAQYIFSRLCWDRPLTFVTSREAGSDDPLEGEAEKLTRERETIPALARSNLQDSLPEYLSLLGDELRHYDSLSYYPLLAIAGLLWAFWGLEAHSRFEGAAIGIVCVLTTLPLLHLYWRFADTARVFRSLIDSASFYHCIPTLPHGGPRVHARWVISGLVLLMLLAVVVGRFSKPLLGQATQPPEVRPVVAVGSRASTRPPAPPSPPTPPFGAPRAP